MGGRRTRAGWFVLLAVGLAACPRPPAVAPPPPTMPPAVEAPRARRLLAAPPDRRDATADRTWCRRACRHLASLAGAAAPEPELDACAAICTRWGSPDRVRCVLEAGSIEEAERCAW